MDVGREEDGCREEQMEGRGKNRRRERGQRKEGEEEAREVKGGVRERGWTSSIGEASSCPGALSEKMPCVATA